MFDLSQNIVYDNFITVEVVCEDNSTALCFDAIHSFDVCGQRIFVGPLTPSIWMLPGASCHVDTPLIYAIEKVDRH